MITITIAVFIVCFALILAVLDTQSKLRQANATIDSLIARDADWSTYADRLESQLAMVQSFHRATFDRMMVNYNDAIKTIKVYATNTKSNGNGDKQSKPQAATGDTLASLGAISDKEQRLIDKWSDTPEEEVVKRITNIRASNAKHQAKVKAN